MPMLVALPSNLLVSFCFAENYVNVTHLYNKEEGCFLCMSMDDTLDME